MTNTTSTKEHIEQRENLKGIPFVAVAELRDYFAAGFAQAQATATSADSGYIVPGYVDPRGAESVAQKIARISYAMADAMLEARSK